MITMHEIQYGRDTLCFYGVIIGTGTSASSAHTHGEGHAPIGSRCSGCRWTEITLYRTNAGLAPDARPDTRGTFVYVAHGHSSIPGESRRTTIHWANGASDLVAAMYLLKNGTKFLPRPSHVALARAAQRDQEIAKAYATLGTSGSAVS